MHIIDEDMCIGCGACVAVCPSNAIEPKDSVYTITSNCTDCTSCVDGCPVNAISAG